MNSQNTKIDVNKRELEVVISKLQEEKKNQSSSNDEISKSSSNEEVDYDEMLRKCITNNDIQGLKELIKKGANLRPNNHNVPFLSWCLLTEMEN